MGGNIIMKHIMLDIETAGNCDNALVVSLGAVEFDPFSDELGSTFSVYFDPLDVEAKGGVINMSTMLWWMQQDPETMRRQFGGSEGLKRGLVRFSKWYKGLKADRSWAHGTTFDSVIMKNAFNSVNVSVPWKYNEVRDMRWFQDLQVGNFQQEMDELYTANAAKHDGLADAKMQARIVQLGYKWLGLKKPEEVDNS
jgi:hypothetical protein